MSTLRLPELHHGIVPLCASHSLSCCFLFKSAILVLACILLEANWFVTLATGPKFSAYKDKFSLLLSYTSVCSFCNCFVLRLYWFIQSLVLIRTPFMVRISNEPIEKSQNTLQTKKKCNDKYDPKREIHFIHQCIVTIVSKLILRKYGGNKAWSCTTQSIIAKPVWPIYIWW